jgi:hypothetical protein
LALALAIVLDGVVWLVPLLVCVAKGKYWVALFCTLGVFTILSALVLIPLVVPFCCALRLAKPSSLWARRLYSDAKLARARERFASPAVHEDVRDEELIAAWEGVEIDRRTLDRMTRKALEKEGLI